MAGERASAVIVRGHLPAGLESLRRRGVPDALDGLPAHLTLLYPFVEPAGLDATIRRRIGSVAGSHDPFEYRFLGAARWPDTLYVAVAPVEPFVALQADLAAAFPDHPIYGEPADFAFVPHVTIAEGHPASDPALIADPAWAALPRSGRAAALEVIATDGRRWRLVWRLRLGRRGRR
jgi:2'-5' RNA ligase